VRRPAHSPRLRDFMQMRPVSLQTLTNFTTGLKSRLELFAQERVVTDRAIAPRFNVFDYIKPNENRLSDIIAHLLDPHGRHGQGDSFLSAFCENLHISVPATVECKIHRENPTSRIERHLRRIDILVDFGSSAIAIENKPWATDEEDQIKDYVDHLEKRFAGNFTILYLTSEGRLPTSIPAAFAQRLRYENKLNLIAYRGLIRAWLEVCQSRCDAPNVRVFLKAFVNYIDDQFHLATIQEPVK
jgi:hypothetical protein